MITGAGICYTGLSGDTKPTSMYAAALFVESDTGKLFVWSSNSTWVEQTTGPGGTTPDPVYSSYAPGSFTVATGRGAQMVKRLQLTTTQRATLAGTARLSISN